jgi:hypothetical protein
MAGNRKVTNLSWKDFAIQRELLDGFPHNY